MEEEWSDISVSYPQYVYTVSGWVQVIDVPTYKIKPIQVFIVPHSHQDLGIVSLNISGLFDCFIFFSEGYIEY